MKKLLMFLLVFTMNSCQSMALRSIKKQRKKADKYWHVCTYKELKNPLGKLCSRSCIKWVGKRCKKTILSVLVLSSKSDHAFALANSLTCLDEDEL